MKKNYFPSEVAKMVGIGASTLRKYCISIEEKGYLFERRINRSRIFYEQDIVLIKRIITMILKKHATLEQAIDLCIPKVLLNNTILIDLPSEISDSQNKAFCEQLEQMNQLLIEHLKYQQTFYEQLIEQICILLKQKNQP